MSLEAQDHQRAQMAHKAARNAYGRAWRWCSRTGATVTRWQTAWGNPRWTVSLSGFHPVTDSTLEAAVAQLSSTVEHFCAGSAVKGPTGAKLDRLRGILAG